MIIHQYTCDSDAFDTVATRERPTPDWLFLPDLAAAMPGGGPLPVAVDEHGAPGDFYSFQPHLVVMTDRARRTLSPLLDKDGQFFPLDVAASYPVTLWLYVPVVLDCLDEARSTIERDEDVILWIDKYRFHPEALRGHDIFRVRDFDLSSVFVTQAVLDAAERAGLRGLLPNKIFEDLG